jgi:hypothetical protein
VKDAIILTLHRSESLMTNLNQAERRKTVRALFILLGFMTLVTWFCQWKIFKEWDAFAQSILIGTCMTLFGAFAAVLASPYGAEDEKRLSKVSTTVFTLVTGYVLAKIIDPLVAQIIAGAPAFLSMSKGSNLVIGLIGFLAGFLGTYVYRAYRGVDVFREELPVQGGTGVTGVTGSNPQDLPTGGTPAPATPAPPTQGVQIQKPLPQA